MYSWRVPLTAAGKLKVVAYADLGGLGPRQGAAVAYDWVAPSIVPQILPWLAVLALLLLKSNRCASAWWIWVPLGLVGGAACWPEPVLGYLPPSEIGPFLELISALGFGLAAVWLLAGCLAGKHRMLAFGGILLTLAAFAALAFLVRQDWEGFGVEALQVGIFLGASGLVISVALTLVGLVSRGRYGWLRLSLWLMAALVVLWLLIIGPFLVIMALSTSGVPMLALFGAVGMAAGITFGVVLPFLVLSFANGFYRDRLKGLLHLGAAATPPPVSTPPTPVVPVAVGG